MIAYSKRTKTGYFEVEVFPASVSMKIVRTPKHPAGSSYGEINLMLDDWMELVVKVDNALPKQTP